MVFNRVDKTVKLSYQKSDKNNFNKIFNIIFLNSYPLILLGNILRLD